MPIDFSNLKTSMVLTDERDKPMRFPNRRDYLDLLLAQSAIAHDSEFIGRPDLVEEVYLDWLRHSQVGCVFAQLLGRPRNRKGLQVEVITESAESKEGARSIANRIDRKFQDAVDDTETEGLSVLMPAVRAPEEITNILLALAELPRWKIEYARAWRSTLMVVGLRAQLSSRVWAEVLGLGPVAVFPYTRQSPITSLEIRTKEQGSIFSKFNPAMRAAHLAQLPTRHFLTPKEHRDRFKTLTPKLRLRVLGGQDDKRAKAAVTFAIPAAIWRVLIRNWT